MRTRAPLSAAGAAANGRQTAEPGRGPGRAVAAAAALLVALGAGWVLLGRDGEVAISRSTTVATRPSPAAEPPATPPEPADVAPAAPVEPAADPVTPAATPARATTAQAETPPAAASPRSDAPAVRGRANRLVLTLEETLPAARADGSRPGPAAPADGPVEVVEYTVVRGDTLWEIARRFTRNPFRYREIASENELRDPALIFPGQALTLRIRRLPSPAAGGTPAR
jgi:5'-nucleotidase